MNTIARFALVTDSASDLSQADARELGLSVVPLRITFSDGEYRDGVDLAAKDFYQKMADMDEIPSTSQPAPIDFQHAFEAGLAEFGEVVCVCISSKLSGTYDGAMMARDLFDEERRQCIHVIDTLNLCIGQQLLVRIAARMRDDGMTAAMVVDAIEHLKHKVRLVAMFSTLENLKKGGRIPKGVAKAGMLLSIKPCITVDKGKIAMLGLAKGSKNGKNMIRKALKKHGGVDYDRPFAFAYTGRSSDTLVQYLKDSEDLYGTYSPKLSVSLAGAAIGTHAGPGAIACAYISKD